jgi:uncharacterized protein (DUF779 family)
MTDRSHEAESELSRVAATPEALALLHSLGERHGPLILHQSGGCCDGSAPMCYPKDDFRIGMRDVRLGEVGGVSWFIGGKQFTYWAHTHLTLDVVEGRGSGFSLEAPEGVRFIIRSRLLTEEESRVLAVDVPGALQ